MDYLRYWSLLKKPFAGGDHLSNFGAKAVQESTFFAGVSQREAIAGLNYFVAGGIPAALLTAPARGGMTTLLRYAKQMRGFGDDAAEVVLTDGDQSSRAAVQTSLCRALGYAGVQDDAGSQIKRAIEATARQRVKMIWLIDRCNQTAARVAGDLVRAHSDFAIVIAATPAVSGKMAAEVGQYGMEIDLTPLSVEDTIEYLHYCLCQAGATRRLFSDNAAVRLHEITGGLIADLAAACEAALAVAASHRMNEVTPAIIEAIDERMRLAA